MSPKSRQSNQSKQPAKPSAANRGTKRVQAASATRSERPKEARAPSHRGGAARFPSEDEDTQRRSNDGREEQDYRDEVMHTRKHR